MPLPLPSRRAALALLPVGLFALACGGGSEPVAPSNSGSDFSGYPAPPGLRAEFTFFPVEMTDDGTIEPLGHLAPVGHTLPTDHVYFYPQNYDKVIVSRDTTVRKVFAPAGGVLFFMLGSAGTDYKLMFRVTKDFHYYLDHIFPRAGLKLGDIVQAGEVVGTTGRGAAIDLGAFDFSTTPISFVQPKRYGETTNYCVSPFRYFVEPLRSQIYARQRRKAGVNPTDPTINFDVPGRLIGNWFDETLPLTPDGSNGPAAWPHHLALVYDNYDPSMPRVSIGGTISSVFLGTIPPDAPRFENVSVATGKVVYSLRYTESTQYQWGLLLVQMLADDRMRVEVVESTTATTAEFSSNSHIYVR